MATFRTRTEGGKLTIIHPTTHESMIPYAPVVFGDDFLGDAIAAEHTMIDVSTTGDTTPLLAADVANGVIRFPLDVTSEAQESGLTWGNQRPFALNLGPVFEARVRLNVLPTLLSEAVWGLAGYKNAVADSVAEGIWFKADGGGAIVVETDDGTTNNDDVATGVTVVADEWAIYRIDCSDPTNIRFYINGASVATGTTFSANAVTTLALQPYFHIAKASGAGLGVLDVDYFKVWQNRA